MRKNIYLFFICLVAFLNAQTSINENFNSVNGGLPTDWEGVFDEGLGYDTTYSYGINYEYQDNPDDRSLNIKTTGSGISPNNSGWVLTSALAVEANEDYEYAFYIKLPVGKKVRFVFASGVSNETFLMTNILQDYSSYFTNNTEEEWVKINGTFTSSTTGELYFGFKGFYPDYDNSEFQTLTIDDVLIRKQPDCIPPSNIAAGTISYNSADFTWEYDATNTFNVKVFEKGANIDSATPVYEQTVTGQSVNVTNLEPATNYDFYVQSDCASDGTSDWSDKVTFTTICAPDNASFFEDFAYADNIGNDGPIPMCWSKIEDPAPDGDQNYNTVTTQFGHVQLGQWVKDGEKTMFITPKLSTLNPNTNYRLRFKVANPSCVQPNTGRNYYEELRYFEVGTMTDPTDASTYTPFKTLTVPVSGEVSVNFNTYTGNDKYVVFNRTPNADRVYTIDLDDIYWEEIPATQPVPECVSSLSYPDGSKLISPKNVHLLWTPVGEANEYKIKIGTSEGAADILPETTVTDFSYELTSDLSYDTTYFVSVVAVNTTGESQNCSTYQFTTYKNPYYGGGNEDTVYGGYYFANSMEEAEPSPIDNITYDWIDPVENNHTLIGANDWVSSESDATYNPQKKYFPIADMPFEFPFYGNNYGSGKIYINHNGAIFFRDQAVDPENEQEVNGDVYYPGAGGSSSAYNFKNMIGAFFATFEFEGTQVYYHTTTDRCVITWYNAKSKIPGSGIYSPAEIVTAQAILYSNGDVKIQINSDLSSFNEVPCIPYNISFFNVSDIVLVNSDASKVTGYKISDAFGPIFNEDTNPFSSLAIYFTPNPENMAVNDIGIANKSKIVIYPNPTQGIVKVNAESAVKQIHVYRFNGQKVKFVENTDQVDISDLSNGIYIVNVTTEKGAKSFKVIKK